MYVILTQCFPPQVGGIENLMRDFALAIHEAGHELTVLADGKMGRAAPAFPFRVLRFGGWKPLRRWRKGLASRKVIFDPRVKMVIADSWKSLEYFDGCDAPVLCLAHGMEFPPKPSEKRKARMIEAFSKADHVYANSKFTAEQAAPYVDADKLTVMPLPLMPQPEPPRSQLAVLRNAYGNKPMIASLCRLEPRKGIDRLIGAMRSLRGEATLLIAGDGPDRARLEELANASPAHDDIHFLGKISDEEKAALMRFADVFAMPTRREGASVEGFGLVYLEAGWYGTPSLAGIEGGASDAVLDGTTGLLCDGSSQMEVTESLQRLLHDYIFREKLGKAACEHAKSQVWNEKLALYLKPSQS
ncbi:MAG: glycosyltransferase family 4 protein [Rhodobacteraceae bacterium]|nr:glycosyltransferase family 4 protein [Paracoccaceae bacterium]